MNVRIRFDTSQPPAMIKGRDLVPNPMNWRTHPEAQADAMRGILSEIGVTDVLKGVRLPDGRVQLIDGHLRAETLPDQEVPVIILDLDDAEAKKVLATFDAVGDIAGVDTAHLDSLLREVETESPGLQAMLNDLAAKHGLVEAEDDADDDEAGGDDDIPNQFQILLIFDNEHDQAQWLEKLSSQGLQCRSLIS